MHRGLTELTDRRLIPRGEVGATRDVKDRSRPIVIGLVIVLVVVVATLAIAVEVPRLFGLPSTPLPGYPVLAVCPRAPGNSTEGNWTTYHQSNDRSGAAGQSMVTAVRPLWPAGPVALDGQVYAEPLACGPTLYVATEGDSVYAINATDGTVLWRTHLGTPMPGSALPCGDIDPSGITGTPVIDVASGTLYAVAFVTPGQHILFGLNVVNGSVRSHVDADPAGSDPLAQQERGALTLANGYVYVVYGGLYGDCSDYHGWVIGIPSGGAGGTVVYQVPTHREGSIWGTAGATVGANGDLYVATGNGDSSTTFDHGDAVIELSPSLSELGHFAPTNWAQLNADDTDLGSVAPALLPNGDLFQIGKAGVGYLLDGTNLGGIGGEIASASVCAGAYGATARVGMSIFVPCTDGVVDVAAGASGLTVTWRSGGFDAGSPIVTGSVVWSVDLSSGELRGLNASTGQLLFSYPLGAVDHFISPTATPGRLFVGAGSEVMGLTLD